MDRNSIIGIILIVAILFGSYFLMQPSEKELKEMQRRRDSIGQIEQQKAKEEIAKEIQKKNELVNTKSEIKADSIVSDSAKAAELQNKFGVFSPASEGKEKFIVVETNKLIFKFTTRGGRPYSVKLKDYVRTDSSKVELFEGDKNTFGFSFYSQNRDIQTNNLFFAPQTKDSVIKLTTGDFTLKMRLQIAENKYIDYAYKIPADGYMLDFNVLFNNVNEYINPTSKELDFTWQIDVPSQEKGKDWETQNSTIYYKYRFDEVDYLTENADEKEQTMKTNLQWVAFKQQFFSSVLIAKKYIVSGNAKYVKNVTSPKHILNFYSAFSFPFDNKAVDTIPMQMYFGPNHYNTLESYNMDLEKLVPLGWGIFGWVNMFIVIPLFNFLGSFIGNFGIIILLLTIIIKMGLFPLTYKSYVSQAKMRVLKPQVDELGKKFPKAEDAMKKQQATMALYRKVGVNPMGGCLPMLLQMPILIAMYRFFPASIELRHQGFLWADDLSTYDSILQLPFTIPWYGDHVSLFTLLMAGSMILTTKISNSQMGDSNSQIPGMKIMMWMMPVMMLLWFNNYSSGLSYYYFIVNIITYLQTITIQRFVDDKDLLKKLEATKAKPEKKSSFQARLEEMAKKRGYNPKK
jgi:YidC/Oxa1 family membrane protein insertase